MRSISRDWRAPATLAGLVVVLVAVLLVGLGPRLGFTAGAPHLWTERPPAISQTVTPAPAWVEIAKVLKPAVVNISTQRPREAAESPTMPDADNPFEDFFRQFRGRPAPDVVHGLGSGFIISPDGDIVTNNHVVDGATEIKITMSDGREFTAKILGRDPKTDVALLKIEARNLPLIPLGDTSEIQVGEPVMAIGNPFGLEQTVTTGIVSATGRVIGEGPYDDFIQTDASINPGNSGGPLINSKGQAVGINTALVSQSGGSVGIGFAIPINLAKPVLTQLASTGHVERGYLGVAVQRLTSDLARSFKLDGPQGALVASVSPGSPAMKAGVKSGDVIVEYDGHRIARSDELPRVVAETPIGKDVALVVVRDGKRVTMPVKVARLAEAPAQAVAESKSSAPLGLSVQTLTPGLAKEFGLHESAGVLVRGVEGASPAADAGVKPGDVIAEIDHQPVKTVDDLERAIEKRRPGSSTLLLVHRNGGDLYIALGS
jgi:serine protease Do